MMYVGDKPMYGVGTQLGNVATSAEAIKAARLDYVVEKRPLFIGADTNEETLSGEPKRCANYYATVRIDTNKPLGMVKDRYRVIQNVDAFEFFDTVVGDKQAMYHMAGALGDGERVFIVAKIPSNIIVFLEDILRGLTQVITHSLPREGQHV